MNDLKLNLTRFLDFAVKHLNLYPERWTIESEQDIVILRTDDNLILSVSSTPVAVTITGVSI